MIIILFFVAYLFMEFVSGGNCRRGVYLCVSTFLRNAFFFRCAKFDYI